jgi:hypothetical protein
MDNVIERKSDNRIYTDGIRDEKIKVMSDDIQEIKTMVKQINERCMRQCYLLPYYKIALVAAYSWLSFLTYMLYAHLVK